jgi:hypothetical protein
MIHVRQQFAAAGEVLVSNDPDEQILHVRIDAHERKPRASSRP